MDDWALRKRHTYGTMLVDLDRRRPVALLPGREADTLATWLREHPGVGMISRDRAGAFAKGARNGAPKAVQVADRFHLLQNLAGTLEVVFTAHAKDLRAAEQGCREAGGAEHGKVSIPPPEPQAKAQVLAAARREPRLAAHERVWELHGQGYSGEAIARHLGISRSTVFRHLRSETFPERKGRADAGHSLLDPWQRVVFEHWNSAAVTAARCSACYRRTATGAATPRWRATFNACAQRKELCWPASQPSSPGQCWSRRPGAC